MKEILTDNLRNYYNRIDSMISKNYYEFILNEIFDLDDILLNINKIFEDFYEEFFLLKKNEIDKYELMKYEDSYDFINTLTKIDTDDLSIYFTEEEIVRFAISLRHIINRAFNLWIQDKKLGLRKGSKLYLEIQKDGIFLYFYPEIKI